MCIYRTGRPLTETHPSPTHTHTHTHTHPHHKNGNQITHLQPALASAAVTLNNLIMLLRDSADAALEMHKKRKQINK